MNKKAYLKPEMQVVMIRHTEMLMISNPDTVNHVRGVQTNMPQGDVIELGGSDAVLGENPIIR